MKDLVRLATLKIATPSIRIIAFLIVFSFTQNTWATTISSTPAGGDWNSTTTWAGGVIPTSADDVIIVAGSSVVVRSPYFFSTPAVCNSLIIAGTLTVGSGSSSDHRLDVLTFIQIDNGGTLNQGGNAIHNIFIAGNFTNNGTFTPTGNAGSVKFTFNGTTSQVVSSASASMSFADIVLNLTAGQSLSFGGSITSLSTGAITQTTGDFVSPSNLTASGDLKLYAGNFTAGSSTVLGGNFTNNGATFNAGSGTVTFSGTSQTIDGSVSTTFNNLTLGGTTNTGVNQVANVNNDLVVNDGATLTINNQIMVNGATTIGAGTSGNLSIASASGSKVFEGLVTINPGATWSNSANTNVHFEGGLSNTGTFNSGSGIHFFETNSQEINGTVSVSTADVSISLVNKGTFTITGALQGSGNVSQGANSVLNIGGTISTVTLSAAGTGNTVNFTTGTQSVRGINYVNLGLAGGAKTFTTNTTSISGNLTFTNGATATTVIPVAIGGNLSVGDGCSYTINHTDISISGTTTVGGGSSGTLTISDAAGTKTFVGLVTILSGATWDNSIGGNAHFQNGIQNNGTFTAGAGTYFFETNSQSVEGNLTMNKIAVASGITLTNNASLTITTDLSAASAAWVQGANSTLNIGGSSTFQSLDATTALNTVNYAGASQSVKGFNYYNLGLTGTGTVTLLSGISNITDKLTISGTVTAASANAMTIGGDFFVADGSQFTISGFNFSVGGKTTIGGGASGILNFTSLAGVKTFSGLVTIKSGGTWNNSTANSAITFQGGLDNSGTFSSGTGAYTFDTNNQSINSTLSIANVVINSITLTNNNSLTVGTSISGTGTIKQGSSSTLIINGSSTVSSINGTATGNSVTYNSASPTVIGGTYNNVTLNQSSGDATLGANALVQGTLTLSTGNLDLGANNLTLATTASLSIASPSASTMIITSGAGELRKNVSATGSFTFPVGENTGTIEYSPITVNVTSGSFSSAYLAVKVVNTKHPSNASSTDYLNRYWTLSQTGIGGCTIDISGSYLLADVVGTESNIKAAQLAGTFNQTTNGWKRFSALNAGQLSATSALLLTPGQSSVFTGISGANPTVSITGGGVTVCAGTPVQLGANGAGIGTLAYSWNPSTGLSSAIVANPTATLSSTTIYTLTVFDGNGISSTDNTTISIHALPAKPSITGSGLDTTTPTLTSSSTTGNQWFKGGSTISGATNQTYQTDINGSYTVQVTDNATGCKSPMSDVFNLIITGLENPGFGGDLFIFPIPTDKQLSINWGGFIPESIVEVRIYDLLGRTILSKCMMTNENVIDVSHLAAGQFVFQASQQNQFRSQRFTKK